MFNAVAMIDQQLKMKGRDRPALLFPHEKSISFQELAELSYRVQNGLLRQGMQTGQTVLLALELSPLMYATLIACARLGLPVALVEPWMPLQRIEQAISLLKPRGFIAGWLGQVWGLRIHGVRKIPLWLPIKRLLASSPTPSPCLSMDPEHPCIITFTSGSTGLPKGVVRTHAYLQKQHDVISSVLQTEHLAGPDLVTFANITLENLTHGRCSLIMPSSWKKSHFAFLEQLPTSLQPVSMIAGPAFLKLAMQNLRLPELEALFIGGALADCHLFEAALARWPEARSIHVYGSTEAEPVAYGSMQEAVHRSRAAGYFQVLFSGQPTKGMSYRQEGDSTWISGPHVCPEYLGDTEGNHQNKRRDADGTLWHRMGDRISMAAEGWYYQGREQQRLQDFLDEQKLYTALQSSDAMLDRNAAGERIVYSQDAQRHKLAIYALFPDTKTIYQADIKRDRRHRARLDRDATRGGKLCNVG